MGQKLLFIILKWLQNFKRALNKAVIFIRNILWEQNHLEQSKFIGSVKKIIKQILILINAMIIICQIKRKKYQQMIKKNIKNKKVATAEQWIQYGKKMRLFIVFFEQKVLDLSDFLNTHPGGSKAIVHYRNKDITKILFQVYPHSQYTKSVLKLYSIGSLCTQTEKDEHLLQLNMAISAPHPGNQQRKASILKIRNTSQKMIDNEQQKKYVGFNSKQNQIHLFQKQNSLKNLEQDGDSREQLSTKSAPVAHNEWLQYNIRQQEETINEYNSVEEKKNIKFNEFTTNFFRI